MKMPTCLVFFFLIFSITGALMVISGPHHRHGHDHKHDLKLFVFGDSYADTGNWPKPYGGSWKEPYGITFPGTPSGRFSNGRVLTDYVASFLGTKSPITYRSWKSGEKKSTRYGMNFAYGGTGVFDTLVNLPNMTTQINYFQQLVEEEKVFTKQDLNPSSTAVFSVAGNDYATYMASNGTLQGLPSFTKMVINQLAMNIKRVYELGVRKVAITAMGPLGCLPQFTVSTSYENCSDTENSVAEFHNQVLEESVTKLNNETKRESLLVILDLYKAFFSALDIQENHASGDSKFENLLKPCCKGVTEGYSCGDIDETGTKKYSVCANVSGSFFWDVIHPSQEGWRVVSSNLRSTLQQLL